MLLIGDDIEICKKYSAKDDKGLIHCNECPLVLRVNDLECHNFKKSEEGESE